MLGDGLKLVFVRTVSVDRHGARKYGEFLGKIK